VLEKREQRFPLQLVLKTMVRQAVHLQSMEVHWDPTPEQVDA